MQCFSTFLLPWNPKKCDNHSRNPMQLSVGLATYRHIRKVEISECLHWKPMSSSAESKNEKLVRVCMGQSPQQLTIKQQAKYLLNLTALNNII